MNQEIGYAESTQGTRDPSFQSGDGGGIGAYTGVRAVATQSDGKIIIGGSFTSYNAVNINRIARLNSDGSIDTSFNAGTGFNEDVYSIAIQSDGKVLVGGYFTTYNGASYNFLIRLNSDGSPDTSFNTGTGPNTYVNAIAVLSSGKILIGGRFWTYNGTSKNCFARLNSDGSLDTTLSMAPDAEVTSIVLQSDGKILLGGWFNAYNSTSSKGIVRLTSTGAFDSSFSVGTGAGSTVYAIAVQSDGKILIGGGFTTFNGTSINRIARLNASGSLDTTFVTGTGADNYIYSILPLSSGKILIGGAFGNYNNTYNPYLISLTSTGGIDTGFTTPNLGANAETYAIVLQSSGNILIGNTSGGGIYYGSLVRGIIRINSSGAVDNTFNSLTGASDYVGDIVVQTDGKIIIVGGFTQYKSSTANRIVRLNSDGSVDTSFSTGTGANSSINHLMIVGSKILITGNFTNFNGNSANYIARLNSDGSFDTSFNTGTGANDNIYDFAIADGKIIIVGAFTSFNGSSAKHIARLNSDGSFDTSFNSGTGTNYYIGIVAVQNDGKMLITGAFSTYNGTSCPDFIRINSDGSMDTSFAQGSGPNQSIYAIIPLADGKTIIGGSFTSYNGKSKSGMARLNSDGSLDTSFNTGTGSTGDVRTVLLQSDGKFIIGGTFIKYNNISIIRVARLNSDGSLDTEFNPGTGPDYNVNMIAEQSDGNILVGGTFDQYNSQPVNYLLRVFNELEVPPTLSNVNLNNGNDISLSPTGPISVALSATVSDANGYDDINNSLTVARAYRSGVSGTNSCSPDSNNCLEPSSCSLNNCSGTACTLNCNFNFYPNAEATSSDSTYTAEYWQGYVKVFDQGGNSATAYTSSGAPEVTSLLAYSFDTSALNYGTLFPGGDTGATNQVLNLTNLGNVVMDLSLSGSSLCVDYPDCSSSYQLLPATIQHYSFSPFEYASGNQLNNEPELYTDFNLGKATAYPSQTSKPIYWGIALPSGVPAGVYNGIINIEGVSDTN